MNASFHAVCEAAAERWAVPALVVATHNELVAIGCEAETRFRIASVTKPLTALLALSLLELDEPTGVWPDDVRVRHLLSHTSGFDCELPDGDNAKYGSGDDALPRCIADLPQVRRLVGADVVWSYANTGYWLAGQLAAERAGTTYEDALVECVLAPAGLDATDFGEPDVAGSGEAASAGPYPRSRRPSGGLVSNAPDLARFARWFLARDESQRSVHAKPVGGVYGLGLFGERVGGVDVWGHSGSYGGFQSSFLTVPSHGAFFVGLTNTSLGSKALAEIEDVFFERVVGAPRRRPPFVEPEPGELAAYVGTYENSDGRTEVEVGEGELVLRTDGEEIVGRKIQPRTFRVPDGPHVHERFDFPLEGFGRFGSRLAVRV
jgi:CubicO group peptidase (beta-lactamase class C family)